MELLIQHRADLNVVNKNGLTPIEVAIDLGNNPFKCDLIFFNKLIKIYLEYSCTNNIRI